MAGEKNLIYEESTVVTLTLKECSLWVMGCQYVFDGGVNKLDCLKKTFWFFRFHRKWHTKVQISLHLKFLKLTKV